MNQRLIVALISLILLVIFSSGCGQATPSDSTPEPAGAPTNNAPALEQVTSEAPTLTPPSLPQGYPPAEESAPENPQNDPDYPGPPTPQPTIDPYPGGLIWILRPVGIQCEDGTEEGYRDLQEAVATLIGAGVTVSKAEMTEMMVTAVCGAPTSEHYLVQISSDDLELALSMGWKQQ